MLNVETLLITVIMKAHEKKEKKNITCVNVHETHLFVKLIPDFRTKWNVSFSCNKCVNNNNQNRASFFLVSIITFLFFFLLLLLSHVFPIRLTDASCFFWRKNIIIIPFIQFINMKLSFFSLSLSELKLFNNSTTGNFFGQPC